MPVYLLHGFRWPRDGNAGIRIRVIIHNLDEVSANYIQNEHSAMDLLYSFRKEFPDIMKALDGPGGKSLNFIEQYDPDYVLGEDAVCQPYAYVADRVVVIAGGADAIAAAGTGAQVAQASKSPGAIRGLGTANEKTVGPASRAKEAALSVNVEEVMTNGPGLTPQAWEAFADLRDRIAEGEKIGWWVVYNGDPARAYDNSEEEYSEMEDVEEEEPGQFEPHMRRTTAKPFEENKVPTTKSSMTTMSSSTSRDMPPPSMLPVRDKGKRVPGMTASSEKVPSTEAPKPPPTAKSEGFKKFFGKRS